MKQCLDRNVYRLYTAPLISGKRSTTLQYPINRMRLKLVTAQELRAIEDQAKQISEATVAEAGSFVLAL